MIGAEGSARPVQFMGAVLLSTFVLAGCSDSGTNPLLDDVERRYQQWFAQGITDYSFQLDQWCSGCTEEQMRPVVIEVRSQLVSGVTDVETGEAVPEGRWSDYPTISGIFQRILDHLRQSGSQAVVQFDQTYNFPSWTQASSEVQAGAGFSIAVTHFTVLSGG